MAGIERARIYKVARNISASESNVYYVPHACEYVIFLDPEVHEQEHRGGAVAPDRGSKSAPGAQPALSALVLALGTA